MRSPDLKELILTVLERGYLMSLGTLDAGGIWVCDLIYVHDDDLNIYWMSNIKTRHSLAIEKDTRVAGTVTVSGKGEMNAGIQFSGCAERIEGYRYDLVLKHFAKRNKAAPKEGEDVLQGRSWYRIRPEMIELIDERYFGFKKQIVTF